MREKIWANKFGRWILDLKKLRNIFVLRIKHIHTYIHREMVKNEDIRGGMGDITFNMNISWFLDLAESMGWSLMTDYFCDYPDLIAKCPSYDEYSFMKATEDTIATFFNDSSNFTCLDETTLDTAIWNYLEAHEDTWFSMFKNFFVYTEDADAILRFWEQFFIAKVGDAFEVEGHGGTMMVEKTIKTMNGYMVGVKSPLARNTMRQILNDWFVDAFVVIMADETITHADLEAYRAERDGELVR